MFCASTLEMLVECFGPLLVFCVRHTFLFFSGFVKDIVSSWIPKCRVPVNRCEKSWLSYFKHGTTALSHDHTDTKQVATTFRSRYSTHLFSRVASCKRKRGLAGDANLVESPHCSLNPHRFTLSAERVLPGNFIVHVSSLGCLKNLNPVDHVSRFGAHQIPLLVPPIKQHATV